MQNGASSVSPKLVLGKRRTSDAASISEEVIRIQHFVPQELIYPTMVRVGARLRRKVDDSAGKSPVLGAEIVRLDFEFLNGILRRYHGDDVQVRSIGGHAVDQDLALPGHASANLKISRSEGISA